MRSHAHGIKVVLDIETVQAPREDWARLAGLKSPATTSSSDSAPSDLFAYGDDQERINKSEGGYMWTCRGIGNSPAENVKRASH